MKSITVGSRWWAARGERFVVIAVVEQEGNTWVHYRDDKNTDSPREYSCYQESFLTRFSELPT